jgi:hypothetical protein
MTEQPTGIETDTPPISKGRRVANIVGISLLAVSMVGIGYFMVTSNANSQSRSDHLLDISNSYSGVERVEPGNPRIFDLKVTVDGKTLRCYDLTKEDIADRKPLRCEDESVFIQAKP